MAFSATHLSDLAQALPMPAIFRVGFAIQNEGRAASADVLPGTDVLDIEPARFIERWAGKSRPPFSPAAQMLLQSSEPSGGKNVSQHQFLQAKLCHKPLQFGVLLLQFVQAPRFF